jgi:choline-sulfatase
MVALRALGLLLSLTVVASAQAVPPVKPNVLIIIGDDHAGGTLGIDGDPRRATPRLDRLAREGVRFDRAYCNSPLCTPSRQSLITGRLPHAVGVTQLSTPLPDDAVTLGDWFGARGYATGAIGKMHFNGPAHHGFTLRVDAPEWRARLERHAPAGGYDERAWRPLKDPAAVWLNAAATSCGLPETAMEGTYFAEQAALFFANHKDRPFALVIGFHQPHSPFDFPLGWEGRYCAEQFSAPPVSAADRAELPRVFASLTPDDIRGIQAAYFTSLAFLDHSIGKVLDALEASGLAADTLVVYLGDNGYMLGHHGRFEKHVLYEPAVRVPLIVRWPKRLPADRKVGAMIELVDLLPTLTELCGLPNPPDIHGQSLVPLLEGHEGAAGRSVVISEYLENEEAMARSERYKLIVGTGNRRRQDGYETAHPLPGPYERFYDLEADPEETTDVSSRRDLAAVADRLRSTLLERLANTRGCREKVPPGLGRREALLWCLVPRDKGGAPAD